MSILTDAAMVALPIWLIFPSNMGLKERLNVIFFYCARLLLVSPENTRRLFVLTRERIIPATICQIVYIPWRSDPNYTLQAFPYSICVQVVQFLSFFAVCVVYFWPFIKSLQGGLERSSDTNMIQQYVLSHRSRSRGVEGGSLSLPSRNQRGNRSNYIELTPKSGGSQTQQTHASNTGSTLS